MGGTVQVNFKTYKDSAKYAVEINAGYSSNLFGIGDCPYVDGDDLANREAAWVYGHQMAQRHVRGEVR